MYIYGTVPMRTNPLARARERLAHTRSLRPYQIRYFQSAVQDYDSDPVSRVYGSWSRPELVPGKLTGEIFCLWYLPLVLLMEIQSMRQIICREEDSPPFLS